MSATKDLAITLRRLDYSETSQVLVVFCRETGQQRLIAKGIKRGTKTRFATGIDLLELGEVVYSRRGGSEAQLGTLTEWRQVEQFVAIRRDLPTWYAVQYAGDRTAQVTQEGDPHPDLFDALADLLEQVGAAPPLPRVCEFLVTLLREIGLTPNLDLCVGCGRPAGAGDQHVSARQGGLVCRDCEPAFVEKRRVSPACLALVRSRQQRGASPPASDREWLETFDLLDYFLTETVGHPSRVGPALRAAVAPPRIERR